MRLFVLRPGLQTTVQDAGRTGFRHLGVGHAGAADAYSFRIANLLVGNDPRAAALEITLTGPTLRFERATRIALVGADCDAHVDGRALPGQRPIDLPAGATLTLGACRRGARVYLAVAGGIDVPQVLGSRATDLRAGFGGNEGRALSEGDELALGRSAFPPANELHIAAAWVDLRPGLDLARDAVAHVLPGADALAAPDLMFGVAWRIAAASDRQGLRLDGPRLSLTTPREAISEPLVPGTIQLPPDGQPIVLLADAQTVGGYPVIGTVASADLPRLAQCRPGDTLHLRASTQTQAGALRHRMHSDLERLSIAIVQRWGGSPGDLTNPRG